MSAPGFSDAVKEAARDRADELFRLAWGEPAKAGGREWRARESSAHVMQMHGGKRGLWKDHKSGEGGDILDFVAVQFCGLSRARDDFHRVLTEAARLCGVAEDAPANLAHLEAQRAARAAEDARREERDTRRKAALVAALQERTEPLQGSPAAAYLARRGIDELPPGFGYMAAVPELAVKHPDAAALVAWATDENGTVHGGQRILICPDGSPAKLEPRKPAFGSIGGFPCRIPGPADAPLVICEGPETAASIWLATGFETWAVFGASGFQSAPVPLGRKVILCPDRDAPGSPAANAFDRACLDHAARGADLWIAPAPEDEGSKRDLNDTLQRAGKEGVFNAVNAAHKFTPRDGKGRFTGAGAFRSDMPAPTPKVMDPAQARDAIRDAIARWAERAAQWQETESQDAPPILALAASPGSGKSRMAREVLAELDLTRFAGDVVFTAPTLPLADEAAQHAAELGTGSHVTRGRSAKVPGLDRAMCARPELPERAAKLGLRVMPTTCRRKDPVTGQEHTCPHAAGCNYLSQWASLGDAPELRFEAAQYLTLPGDGSGRETGARVIDESIWRLFTREADIPLDAWTRPRSPGAGRTLAQEAQKQNNAADATRAAGDVLSALQLGASPILNGYTAEDFAAYAEAERGPEVLGVTPDASATMISDALDALGETDPHGGKRAALWAVLADCKRRGLATTERVRLVRDVPSPGTGEPRDVLRVTWLAEPPRDKPVLLLDADATPEILERLYPGAELVRFELKPNAEVVQLTDRTFSNVALKRPEIRREVVQLVRAEVYRDRLQGGRGVLAIATRQAVKAIFEDAGHKFDDMAKDEVSAFMQETELHGARWLWFGPASLGRNDWQDFGTAVVIGREELPIDALEDLTRALFGDTGEPLLLVEPDERGNRMTPEVPLPITMADGSAWAVMGRAHPDPRGRAVQLQTREMATRQGIERLRLVNATDPKRVVVAGKVPIPGLPVSRLVAWDDLKPTRLQVAMAEAAQRGGVLRLSAAGLAADAPETFPTPKAAERWLEKDGRQSIKYPPAGNKGSISGGGVFNPVSVMLRIEGQRGKPTSALVVLPGDPRQMAEAQLGPLALFEVHAIEAAPADTVVPPDRLIWADAARFADQAQRSRDAERQAAQRTDPGISERYKKGQTVPKAVPLPSSDPAPRLIVLPEPERLAVMHQLPAPITYYKIESDRLRLAWAREWADCVRSAFEAYYAMDERSPDAWR